MNEPIKVADALRLIELALADCDKASNGPWGADEIGHGEGCPRVTAFGGEMSLADIRGWGYLSSRRGNEQIAMDEQAGNMRFMPLARATMRPMLKYFLFGPWPRIEVHQTDSMYPPLAALRDHYDAVRPDWRTE